MLSHRGDLEFGRPDQDDSSKVIIPQISSGTLFWSSLAHHLMIQNGYLTSTHHICILISRKRKGYSFGVQKVLLFPLKNTFMKFSHSISSLPHIQLQGSLGTVTFSIVFLRRKRKMYGQHRQPAISASPCFSQRPVHEIKLIVFIKKSSYISQICLPKWCVHNSTYWLYCASDYP